MLAAIPMESIQSQTVMDRVSKRFLKKNRVKKYGKRLVNMGKDPDLIDMAVRNEFEVIGFEPSWMIESGAFDDHYFNLLTTLVVGEYDINPTTGDTRSRSSYRSQFDKLRRDKTAKQEFNIIQKADFHNPTINVLMHMTYYGDYGRQAKQREYAGLLLKEGEVRKTLKDSIQSYFLELENDYGIPERRSGIVLDLQLENSFYNEDFVDFISFLRTELGDDHLIYLKIPAKVRKDALIPFDIINQIEPFVDRFIVQGYGFEKYSRTYSPLVIFDPESSYSIDGTIANYMVPGFEKIIPEKFIVELPWYGVIFKQDQDGNFLLKEGSPYITLDDFNKDIKGRSGTISYKNNNTMAYYVDNDTRTAYLIEDSLSLVSKYIYLVDSLGMNGFAVNALGYYANPDSRRGENWAAIADNFGEKREKIGWVIAYYLAAFLPIGFVYSVIRYWEVRNALAKFTKYWNRFRIFFILSLVIFMICLGFMPRYILVIVGLIIMAGFFVYIMVKKAMMRSKKYVNIVK
ncbi:glycoside hydrolase family 18 protein [Portibacter lacus]|uniref:Uncharacterized protein n=1 Tax=Portibacter lacus TaxID=1099794 RepID=A0AA37SNE3_9BACT|nr:glycoside hydrolase family 18 protein [Portibacter lacus]GLR16699.1 hypothetical protein GCM10007940_13140 [Portibacter lacus]